MPFVTTTVAAFIVPEEQVTPAWPAVVIRPATETLKLGAAM